MSGEGALQCSHLNRISRVKDQAQPEEVPPHPTTFVIQVLVAMSSQVCLHDIQPGCPAVLPTLQQIVSPPPTPQKPGSSLIPLPKLSLGPRLLLDRPLGSEESPPPREGRHLQSWQAAPPKPKGHLEEKEEVGGLAGVPPTSQEQGGTRIALWGNRCPPPQKKPLLAPGAARSLCQGPGLGTAAP